MGDSKPFHEQLRQLESAHEEELQQCTTVLRSENVALRAEVQQLQRALHQAFPHSRWKGSPGLHQTFADTQLEDSTAHGDEPNPAEPNTAVKEPHTTEVHGDEFDGAVPTATEPEPCDAGADFEEPHASGPTPTLEQMPTPNLKQIYATAPSTTSRLGRDSEDAVVAAGTTVKGVSSRSFHVVHRKSTLRAPNDLFFQELAEQKYPGARWNKLNRAQRVVVIREALKPKHWLLSPRCSFMKIWDIVMAVALLFCGVVTPYEAVFLGLQLQNWGLWGLNRCVDVMFLVDFALQFFLMVEVQRPHNGGVMMLRDPYVLRRRYLKSWFIVDLLSTVPYDLISISESGFVKQKAKALRMIKLMRMVKLLRMVRTSRILQRWRDDVSVQFATQRLLTFLLVLLLLSHWMACVWGLVGLTVGQELCVNGNVISDVQLNRVSWVTTLFLGGKTSPDSPCQHFDVYAASLHWAVMTITSIGYGDIVPVRMEEYIIGTICMFAGGVLWAYAIGSVCSIISNRSPLEVSFEQDRDLLNRVMQQTELPRNEQRPYREFLREAKSYDRRIRFREVAGKLSTGLRKQLLFHCTNEAIRQVYYFEHAPIEFMMGVASAVVPCCFSRGEALDSLSHSLCMMDRGTVVHNGMLLVPPNVFHEDFIITNPKLQRRGMSFALTYTQVLVLTREEMEQLLEYFPEFERTVRKYAVRIAFCRALHLTARNYHSFLQGREEEEGNAGTSLSLAFTQTFQVGGCAVPRVSSPHRMDACVPLEAVPLRRVSATATAPTARSAREQFPAAMRADTVTL